MYGRERAARRFFLYGLSMTEKGIIKNNGGNNKMKRITTYAEFQALKAIYKSAKVVSVSDHGALIFLRK